ncbi:unnamed protein product, partial [Arctogadus glacialis]
GVERGSVLGCGRRAGPGGLGAHLKPATCSLEQDPDMHCARLLALLGGGSPPDSPAVTGPSLCPP